MQTQLKISESNPLSIIAYRDSAKCVCVWEREIESVCVCVTSSKFWPSKGQTFCKNKTRSSQFWKRIDRWEGNGEEGRAEGGRKGFRRGWKWGKEGSVLDQEVAWELRVVWEFFEIENLGFFFQLCGVEGFFIYLCLSCVYPNIAPNM